MTAREKRNDVHMCLTSWRSIISWKISPPVMPTNEWSISGDLYGFNGWMSWSSRLKAGAGRARSSLGAAAAVLWGLFAFSLTSLGAVAWAAVRYGETAGRGVEVEKARVALRAWIARCRDCILGRVWRLRERQIGRVGVEGVGWEGRLAGDGGEGWWFLFLP